MLAVWTQAIYLTLSIALTIYVARVLYTNGKLFLVRAFDNDEELANSINALLVVGFYLLNLGWVLIWTRFGYPPRTGMGAVNFVTTKVGLVMLILGGVHFFNLLVFFRMKKNHERRKDLQARTAKMT